MHAAPRCGRVPAIESVATRVPSTRIPQEKLRELARQFLEENDPRLVRVLEVFDHARIDERAFAMPLEWYYERHGHKERAEEYVRVGLPLAVEASREALLRAGRSAREVGGIVFVSTTGIATPSLDARLANALDVPPDALRLPVWGLGCAGGVAGVNRAADLARAHPERVFLVVALELCSLALNLGRFNKKTLVAVSLFADGCAAAVLAGDDAPRSSRAGADARGLAWAGGSSHLFPRTERVMGWDVEDDHLDVVFDPAIPDVVARETPGLVLPFLARANAGKRPEHWLMHPGGAKVLDAYASSLALSERDLALSAATLRGHGNMSSPTVLFVLERAMREGALRAGETALLSALGPGFASELALVRAERG